MNNLPRSRTPPPTYSLSQKCIHWQDEKDITELQNIQHTMHLDEKDEYTTYE